MSGSSAAVPRELVPRGLNLLKDGRESDNGKRAAGLEGPGSARLLGSWGHGDVGDLGPVIADITFAPTAENSYLALEDDVGYESVLHPACHVDIDCDSQGGDVRMEVESPVIRRCMDGSSRVL